MLAVVAIALVPFVSINSPSADSIKTFDLEAFNGEPTEVCIFTFLLPVVSCERTMLLKLCVLDNTSSSPVLLTNTFCLSAVAATIQDDISFGVFEMNVSISTSDDVTLILNLPTFLLMTTLFCTGCPVATEVIIPTGSPSSSSIMPSYPSLMKHELQLICLLS